MLLFGNLYYTPIYMLILVLVPRTITDGGGVHLPPLYLSGFQPVLNRSCCVFCSSNICWAMVAWRPPDTAKTGDAGNSPDFKPFNDVFAAGSGGGTLDFHDRLPMYAVGP